MTSKPLFVFCADLQARESAYRSVKELRGDDLYALKQVVDKTLELGVPLILGGDQVDTPTIGDEHVVALRKQLTRIPNGQVWYVDGNHERGFKRFCLEGGQAAAASNLEGNILNLNGVRVAGYNWRTRRQWESFFEENSLLDADVVVLHGFAEQVVAALRLPKDEVPLCDMNLEWFDGKYKLAVMGDIHMGWDWTGSKGTRFIYPGSMWMHRVNEPESKSFLVVNEDLSVDKIDLKCRPFLRMELSEEKDIEILEKWLDSAVNDTYPEDMVSLMGEVKPRVHLTVQSDISRALAAVIERAKEKAFVFEKIVTSHDPDLSETKGSLDEQVDLDTAIAQVLSLEDPDQAQAAEFVKQAMELGFDNATDNLKQKIGI
jgi:hypothetical protein